VTPQTLKNLSFLALTVAVALLGASLCARLDRHLSAPPAPRAARLSPIEMALLMGVMFREPAPTQSVGRWSDSRYSSIRSRSARAGRAHGVSGGK